jgi:hypothetical protein
MAPRTRTQMSPDEPAPRRSRPATTPEGREQQLVAMAYDLVEKKIARGTASSQELVHFLKLGSSREMLEQERIRNENRLTQTKIEMMASAQRVEELYGQALKAMRSYAGQEPSDDEGEYDD